MGESFLFVFAESEAEKDKEIEMDKPFIAGKTHMENFDCIMICVMLGLSMDRNEMLKLARRFGLVSKYEHDPYISYYALHKGCHSSPELQKHLQDLFGRRYALIKKELAGVADAGGGRADKMVRELFRSSPGGVIWNLLTDGNDIFKGLGVYNVHRVLLLGMEAYLSDSGIEASFKADASPGLGELVDKAQNNQVDKTAEELVRLKSMIDECGREISALNTVSSEKDAKIRALEEKIVVLEARPESEGKLKRQIRKLEYELSQRGRMSTGEPVVPCPRSMNENKECDSIVVEDESRFCENAGSGVCRLDKMKVAVVGGIERLIPRYQEVVEKMGGRFFGHDGDCSGQGAKQLANMVCQAEIVVYITSINSHNALNVVRATCRRSGRSFWVLRSASPDALERFLSEKGSSVQPPCGNHQFGKISS